MDGDETGARRLIVAAHLDGWRHLATEECLLETLPPGTTILYLWRSAPAVVIGKHQNPWLECPLTRLAAAGVGLARRMSGGGAVYHDPGNLNFAFIGWAASDAPAQGSALVLAALRRLGVDARHGPRHTLTLPDGRKFSGSASWHRQQRVLHHGTLLVAADLERLAACLQPSAVGLEARGIRSVPAPVVNLQDQVPGLTTTDVSAALAAAFGGQASAAPDPGERLARHRSWAWCFGRTPPFTARGTVPDTAPAVPFAAEIEQAVVCRVTTEAPGFAAAWIGRPFADLLAAVPSLRLYG